MIVSSATTSARATVRTIVLSRCSVWGSTLAGEGSCVSTPVTTSTATPSASSTRIIGRNQRSRRSAPPATRGRKTVALSPATPNSISKTTSLAMNAAPQSVSTRPRALGT